MQLLFVFKVYNNFTFEIIIQSLHNYTKHIPDMQNVLYTYHATASKITNNDSIREQSEDPSISLIIQLLKAEKLKGYIAEELESSELCVLLKYHIDLLLKMDYHIGMFG